LAKGAAVPTLDKRELTINQIETDNRPKADHEQARPMICNREASDRERCGYTPAFNLEADLI
jgi:hypothetical protein